MPDWIEEHITDQDPRYHELMEQQAEDRRRWAGSPQALAEMARLRDRSWPRPDWKPIPKSQPLTQRVYVWRK